MSISNELIHRSQEKKNSDFVNNKSTNSSLSELIASLPKEVYEPRKTRALTNLLVPLTFCILSVYVLASFPWYFLPIGWFVLGTAVMGLVTVAKDCGKEKFVRSKLLNDLIGTICLLPVMMPFESWKEQNSSLSESLAQSHFWWMTSTLEWLRANFAVKLSKKLVVNMVMLYTFICVFFPLLAYNVGWWGLFKYYFIPFVVFHFWMSSYTKVNYSLASEAEDGPLYCSIPKWLQLMTNNYDMFRVSLNSKISSIPSYNLNDVRTLLSEKFGDKNEISFASALIRSPICNKSTATVIASSSSADLLTARNIESELNWPTIAWMLGTPFLALAGLFFAPFFWQTYLVAALCWISGLMAITAGYHRLFSHRSYDAVYAWRVFMAILGTQTFEGSVFDWCFDHRDHHRFTDTDLDPYNAKRGFFWAHMGWLFFKRDREKVLKSDISDLKADPFLRFQHEYYTPLAFLTGIFVPAFICGLGWGDWMGGFLIAGFGARVVMMQCTFCINSVAHFMGDKPFSDQRTPGDWWFTSLLTFGEGYHNFHHEFPNDYRNGVDWIAYDPAKWVIFVMEKLGLAFNVKRTPDDLVMKGRIQMKQKKLDDEKKKYEWGPEVDSLPVWSLEKVTQNTTDNLIVVDGVVYDLKDFAERHPGGRGYIVGYRGRDASVAFNGGIYNHSNCARNVLRKMAVARVKTESDTVTSQI